MTKAGRVAGPLVMASLLVAVATMTAITIPSHHVPENGVAGTTIAGSYDPDILAYNNFGISLVASSGNGSVESPFVIRDKVFDPGAGSITFQYTDAHVVIVNCTVRRLVVLDAANVIVMLNRIGQVTIERSCNIVIAWNVLRGAPGLAHGIKVRSTSNISIAYNNVTGYSNWVVFPNTDTVDYGVGMDVDHARNAWIVSNNVSDNGYAGIWCRSSSGFNVSRNIITNNGEGLWIEGLANTTIRYNTITRSNRRGNLWPGGSGIYSDSNLSNVTIMDNEISYNKGWGLDCSGCHGLHPSLNVTGNTFRYNLLGSSNMGGSFCARNECFEVLPWWDSLIITGVAMAIVGALVIALHRLVIKPRATRPARAGRDVSLSFVDVEGEHP